MGGRTGLTGPVEEARRLLEGARRVVVLTGAGISAESGVPTFRDAQGLWKTHRPEDLATPEAFRRDPRLVWEWYAWRRDVIAACRPNAAHLALARFALEAGRDVTIVTQNVDGLHDAAARLVAGPLDPFPALSLELHGALFRDRCSGCGARSEARTSVDATSRETLPRCVRCGSLLRPDVVWFGEALDLALLDRALRAAAVADVCLVVGTSAVVYPAASIPAATLGAGGLIVEVNPNDTPLTPRARHSLRAGAVDVLPLILPEAGPPHRCSGGRSG